MRAFVLFVFSCFFPFVLFGQESVVFEDITHKNYSGGVLYVEYKMYTNNYKTAEAFRAQDAGGPPAVIKEEIDGNTYYSFADTYVKDFNQTVIIKAKIKFTNDTNKNNVGELVKDYGLSEDDTRELIENGIKGKYYGLLKYLGYDENETLDLISKINTDEEYIYQLLKFSGFSKGQIQNLTDDEQLENRNFISGSGTDEYGEYIFGKKISYYNSNDALKSFRLYYETAAYNLW